MGLYIGAYMHLIKYRKNIEKYNKLKSNKWQLYIIYIALTPDYGSAAP
jgi:hypothetical protein